MDNTTNLKMPLLVPNQSGKEITHNEALIIIDNILQNGVIDKDLTTPPSNPNTNDIYIIGTSATGVWSGKDKQLAFYDNGWRFIEPREGFTFWINDENKLYSFDGINWIEALSTIGPYQNLNSLSDVSISSVGQYDILQHNGTNFVNTKEVQNLSLLGVNTTANSTNKLSVKSDSVLFDNTTDDSRVKVNKATSTDTASHLFQSNYEGRAEFGLIGDDDFTLKVSSDGSTWNNSFVVDKATGNIDFKGNITNNGNDICSSSFQQLFSTNGYTKFPNGLIIQWGQVSVPSINANSGRDIDINFSISFTTSVFYLDAKNNSGGFYFANVKDVCKYIDNSKFKLELWNNANGASASFTYYWLAIGK